MKTELETTKVMLGKERADKKLYSKPIDLLKKTLKEKFTSNKIHRKIAIDAIHIYMRRTPRVSIKCCRILSHISK
jgi:hypothetical protein